MMLLAAPFVPQPNEVASSAEAAREFHDCYLNVPLFTWACVT